MNNRVITLLSCCAITVLGGWSDNDRSSATTAMGSHVHYSMAVDSIPKWDSSGWSGRVVVGEYMTGIGCVLCQPHERAFDLLIQRYPGTVFIPLAYHFTGNVPIANPRDSVSDRMFAWYDADSAIFNGKLLIGIIPSTTPDGSPRGWNVWIDGRSPEEGGFGGISNAIDAELRKAPEAVLHLEATPKGGKIIAKVQVKSLSPSHQDVYVRMAVVEDTVILKVTDTAVYNSRPAWNKKLNHYMVVRSALRDTKTKAPAGHVLGYSMGTPLHGDGTVAYTFDMAKTQEQRLYFRSLILGKAQPKDIGDKSFTSWYKNGGGYDFSGMEGWTMDPTRLHLVAFVQDAHTGDVLQAQMIRVNTGEHGKLLKLPL